MISWSAGGKNRFETCLCMYLGRFVKFIISVSVEID